MEKVLIVVAAVLFIALVTDIAPRLRIPAPLVLVFVGAVIGIMPFVPAFHVDPEWILVGVLPPLLYSAAIGMPTMDFRRDFTAISTLSVVLVILSAVVVGWFLTLVVPGISLATGVALGAIVSPTDAVATSIAKRMGVPSRVVAVLEGESMLNDASALVLLRAAVAATAATISFWGVALNFVFAVAGAVAIGAAVGVANLWVRSRMRDATANTAISFTVPYIAYVPAEAIGASGLVAAVTAGLITGAGAVKYLTPQHRISDMQNWHVVELIAEGAVFLLMGLELFTLMSDVHNDHEGVPNAVWIGLSVLGVALLVRALYVVPLAWWLDRKRRRGDQIRPMLADFSVTPSADIDRDQERRSRQWWRRAFRRRRHRDTTRLAAGDMPPVSTDTAARINSRITRTLADIDYYTEAPLGPKESAIVVWAGMRGVVTVAAAQTLPDDTPSRPLLVLVAFVVAAASLLIQGGTLPWLIRKLKIGDDSESMLAERRRLRAELDATAQKVMAESETVRQIPWLRPRLEQVSREADEDADAVSDADDSDDPQSGVVPAGASTPYGLNFEERVQIRRTRREIIAAQRKKLLTLRSQGTYSSSALSRALGQLDAEEISLDMQRGS
ncbi:MULTISPECIES: cation:proton antiporter [Gordonia]|uniref:cation:proton antiporter n=1 Tax=Gordonia TaxID=2053 RepID=UPI0007EC29EF|nr:MULTISPECIES: sodium:proton antiporter [Gordonia]OBC02077.1 cation:proton antiporter [Gordonia sp. 852002-50395_SCH5434458]